MPITKIRLGPWALALAIALFGLLAACSSSDDTASDTGGDTSEETTAPAGTEEAGEDEAEDADAAADEPADEPAGDLSAGEVTVATTQSMEGVAVFYAIEQGGFAKHNVAGEVTVLASGVEVVQALANGEADIGVMGSVPLLAGTSNDLPLVMIGMSHGDPIAEWNNENLGLVAGPGMEVDEAAVAQIRGDQNVGWVAVDEVAKLEGKTLGLFLGSAAEPHALAYLNMAGLTRDDVEMVQVAPADSALALREGRVDAVLFWEPWTTRAVLDVPGAVRIAQGGAEGWYEVGTLLANRQFLEQEPDAARAFLATYADSQQWARNNPGEAAEVLTRWLDGMSVEVAEEGLKYIVFDHRLSANIVDGYERSTIPFLLENDMMSKPVEPTDVIDPGPFLDVLEMYPEYYDDLEPIPADREIGQ